MGKVTQVPFTVDPLFLIRILLQMHFDKNYNDSEEHSEATIFSLSESLYANELTEDEIQIIFGRYRENHNLGTDIDLTGEPEQVEEVFSYLFDLPRYKEAHWNYTLQGYGPYQFSVIDLIAKKEYETRQAEHYATLVNVLAENYADEFDKLTQEGKDNFIMENFKLIGKTNHMSWYTPDMPLKWIAERGD